VAKLAKRARYVMKFLGHRSIKNTLTYIDLESLFSLTVAMTTTQKQLEQKQKH